MKRIFFYTLFFICTLGCVFPYRASASVFSKTNTSTTSLTRGLVGWWTMDGKDVSWDTGKIVDRSGQGNTGTLTNMATSASAVGKIGQALNFDGIDDYVSVANTSSLDITGNEISFGGWINPRTSNNYQMIVGKTGAINVRHYAAYLTGGNTSSIYVALSGVSPMVSSGSPLTITTPWVVNQWNHIFVTYKSGVGGFIYLNGQLVYNNSDNWSGTITSQTSNVNIGADATAASYFVDGKVDDARIYNRALSSDEVARIYRQGTPLINKSRFINSSLFSGLVAYYTFDGPTVSWNSRKVNDMSGNGNTLSILTTSTSSATVPGKIGQGASNGGAGEYTASDANSLDLTSTSLFAWIKRRVDAAGYETIISKRASNAANYEMDIDTTAGVSKKIIFYNGSTVSTCNTTIPVGSWQLVGVTVTGSSGVCYLNGARDGTFSAALGATNAGSLSITVNPGGGQYLLADIDEVRVYNRVLSDSEVSRLYILGAGTVNKTPSAIGPLTTGLVGWWTMDGKDTSWNTYKMNDKSGTGNTGTITNMATSSATVGKIGQALKFDGVDDYINAGSSVLTGVTANFSFGGWYRTTGSGYTNRAMGNADSTGGGGNIGIDFIPGANGATKLDFVRRGGTCSAAGDLSITASAATDGNWHHIFYTSDANTYNVYFDGASLSSGTSCTINHGLPWRIGRDGNGTDAFNGTLDDVRVYNRALSAREIQTLYVTGR